MSCATVKMPQAKIFLTEGVVMNVPLDLGT
jgi:hypothetical protein